MWVGPPNDVSSVESEPPRHNYWPKRFQISFYSVDIISRMHHFTKLCLISFVERISCNLDTYVSAESWVSSCIYVNVDAGLYFFFNRMECCGRLWRLGQHSKVQGPEGSVMESHAWHTCCCAQAWDEKYGGHDDVHRS
jgi:hypothetical protein